MADRVLAFVAAAEEPPWTRLIYAKVRGGTDAKADALDELVQAGHLDRAWHDQRRVYRATPAGLTYLAKITTKRVEHRSTEAAGHRDATVAPARPAGRRHPSPTNADAPPHTDTPPTTPPTGTPTRARS